MNPAHTPISSEELYEAARIQKEIEKLQAKLQKILGAEPEKGVKKKSAKKKSKKKGKRKLSAEAREKIRAAVKASWAKKKRAKAKGG